MQFNRVAIILIALCLLGFVAASPARAHEEIIVTEFSDFTPQEYEHEDEDPFKGVVDVTVTNTGTIAWADFHFEIYQIPGWPTVEDVHFITEIVGPDDYRPLKDDALVNFVVDNDVVGARLDLYFAGDLVLPTETVNFKVYTDNTTDNVPIFGLIIYPTPIPEPATMALVGLGALALLVWRKRRA
jgi:hypothetical protein